MLTWTKRLWVLVSIAKLHLLGDLAVARKPHAPSNNSADTYLSRSVTKKTLR